LLSASECRGERVEALANTGAGNLFRSVLRRLALRILGVKPEPIVQAFKDSGEKM
jgi:hypothetical protein